MRSDVMHESSTGSSLGNMHLHGDARPPDLTPGTNCRLTLIGYFERIES
jgi:hypothetical protein